MIHVLTLCTGNVCRSPLSAQLLADRLDSRFFRIESAGLSPLAGDQMPQEMQRIVTRLGLDDPADHRARGVTAETIAKSDLLIAMSRHHRSTAVVAYPPAVRQAFTLLELAHVVSHMDDYEAAATSEQSPNIEFEVLEAVMRIRGTVPRLSPEHLYDVEDPYGRSNQAFKRTAKQVEDAVDEIAQFFNRVLTTPQNTQQERYQRS